MRRTVKNTLRAGALCLVLLVCALFTTALAAEGETTASGVSYVEYSWDDTYGLTNNTKVLEAGNYTEITSANAPTTWGVAKQTSWYVVQGNVGIYSRVQVNGNVNLILTDGSSLNISGGIRLTGSGNSLTIYGQEEGTGRLTATAYSGNAGIGGNCGKFLAGQNYNSESGGTVNIHGGVVIATGGSAQEGISEKGGGAGIGGAGASASTTGSGGAVTIYGGTVTATGQSYAAGIGGGGSLGGSASTAGGGAGGTVKIYGGTVTSNGNGGAVGIGGGTERSGASASHGTLSIKGDAFVVASSIGDTSKQSEWDGVVFNGANGQIYGGNEATVSTDAEIPAGYTLTIGDSQTITVAPGATLAVKGGVTFEGTGKLEVAEGGTLAYYIGADIDLSKVDIKGALTFPEMGTGTGTADDPYTISTADGLRALAELVDSGYDFAGMTIELADDIDLGGESKPWNPIGSHGGGNTKPFNGVFDGGGHTISGLYINDSNMSAAGLFAYIGENGNVQNLAVSGTVNAKANSGGIAAYNHGTISNCYADVDVTVKNSYAGGVAGTSGGTVENCYNLGSIQGKGSVAGIVGSFTGSGERAKIENCYNIGNTAAQNSNIGAILGNDNSISNPKVSNCFYLEGCVSNGNSYGESLTAGQFADSNSFGGWDFNNTWVMSAELGRPVLRSVPEGSEYLIDYVNEKATGLTVYEISTDQSFWQSGAGELKVTPGGTLYVRRVGSEDILETVKLPARPAAPALAINSATQSVTVGDELEYSFDQTEWTSGTGAPVHVDAGDTIYIRYKASQEDGKFSSAIQTLTAPGGAPAPGTPAIDYTGETVGTEAGMQYSLSETGPWTACTADMPAADFGWDGTAPVTVYFRADPGEGYPGEPVALTIPARPAAPVVKGGAGRIAGATTAMEYSSDGVNWTRFTDETLGRMEPGDYQVRYAATESSFRSEAVPVTVAAGGQGVNVPETYGIELIAGEGGEARTNFTNASAGTKITVTATPDEGYELAYITVDGERISGASFTMPDHDVTVRVYFTDAAAPAFVDVDSADWFYGYVQYVARNGLMEGTGEGRFDPDGTMTRAMFWAVLARIDGETITGDGWKTLAQNWAVSSGISDGTSADALITREQMVTMFYRYAGSPVTGGMAISEFTDGASVSDYATDAVTWALSESILTGMGDGILAPQGTATRAQAAAMLMRFVER